MRVIGYYYEAAGELAPPARDDVYGCDQVLASERSLPSEAERLDYGWVQLDRGVAEPLTMFGLPSGLWRLAVPTRSS